MDLGHGLVPRPPSNFGIVVCTSLLSVLNLIPSVQGLFNIVFLAQNAFKRKEEWSCEGCGLSLLYKTSNEIKASIPGCRLCDSCAKVCILRRVAFIVVFSSKMFQEAKL